MRSSEASFSRARSPKKLLRYFLISALKGCRGSVPEVLAPAAARTVKH